MTITAKSSDENDFVGEVMDPGPRLGVGPNDHSEAADNHLNPNARDNCGETLDLCGRDPGFGDVNIKSGCEIEEHQAHAVGLSAVVFAGEPVGRLMDKAQG